MSLGKERRVGKTATTDSVRQLIFWGVCQRRRPPIMQQLLNHARAALQSVPRGDDPFVVAKRIMQNPENVRTVGRHLEENTDITANRRNAHFVMVAIILQVCPDALLHTSHLRTRDRTEQEREQEQEQEQDYVTLLRATDQFVEILTSCETTHTHASSSSVVSAASYLQRFCRAFARQSARETHYLMSAIAVAWVDIEETVLMGQLPQPTALYAELEQHARAVGGSASKLKGYVANRRAQAISQCAVRDVRHLVDCVSRPSQNRDRRSMINASPYRYPEQDASTPFEQSIQSVVRKAFWDAFVARLDSKETDQLTLLLDELKLKLQGLTPSRNDVRDRIERSIDTALITQMVQHRCFDPSDFLEVASFVVEHLLAMQAPADNEATRAWYRAWEGELRSGECSFSQLCADFLQRAHQDIDLVHKRANAINQR